MSPNALVNYAAKVSVPGVFTKLFEDSLSLAAALKEIFKPGAEALGFFISAIALRPSRFRQEQGFARLRCN